MIITAIIFTLRNSNRLHDEFEKYNFNPLLNSNYKFIGGDEKFYFRYNNHLKNRHNNYNYLEILGKKYIYLSRDNS